MAKYHVILNNPSGGTRTETYEATRVDAEHGDLMLADENGLVARIAHDQWKRVERVGEKAVT